MAVIYTSNETQQQFTLHTTLIVPVYFLLAQVSLALIFWELYFCRYVKYTPMP